MAQQLRKVLLIMGVGVIVSLVGYFHDPLDNDTGPIFSEERNRYIALEFHPKYRADDCTVSFDLHLKKPGTQFIVLIKESFQRYVSYHEHKVGAMWVEYIALRRKGPSPHEKNAAPFEVIFADQCDRKNEIFEAMVAYTMDQHEGLFDFERIPDAIPELKPSGFWLDSPDYDPAYWPLYHKAMRGDGKSFYELLRFVGEGDRSRQHLFYALAEYYLSDGPMKDKAKAGKEAAWQQMTPEQKGRQDELVDHWKSNIERYAHF